MTSTSQGALLLPLYFFPYILENIPLVTMGGALPQSGPPPKAINPPSAGGSLSASWLTMQGLVLIVSLIRLTNTYSFTEAPLCVGVSVEEFPSWPFTEEGRSTPMRVVQSHGTEGENWSEL